MPRLFVALRPPPPLRSALLDAMGGIPGARWQDDEQLHLTIRFLGEVDRHQAEDVAAVLGSIAHPAFDLQLDGIGNFESRGRVDTIWAGVSPHQPVRSLHAAVTTALARVGIAAEQRAFLPHITIARFSRGCEPTEPLPVEHLWPSPVVGRFDHLLLYESVLGRSGANYSAIARYRLG